eukprot:3994968-Amphidinium_carterae.1
MSNTLGARLGWSVVLCRCCQTPAKFGGAACVGSLKETTGCGRSQEDNAVLPASEDSPCKVSTWSDWGVCKQVQRECRHSNITALSRL